MKNVKYALCAAVLGLLSIGAVGCSSGSSGGYHNGYYNGYVIYYSGCPYGWNACYYDTSNNQYYYYNSGTGNGSGYSFSVESALSQSDGLQLPNSAILPGLESSETGNRLGSSVGTDTHDTDLQRADIQKQSLIDRAQSISDQFKMDFDKALELTKLADKVQTMTVQGQMTLADRTAVVSAAMGVAGVTESEVNAAVTSVVQDGNQKAITALMEKAAANLGMPSSAGLRDQILPALGIQF